MALMTAIGLMSGTSMDGIDVALLETDGLNQVRRGPSLFVPYEAAFRRRIEASLDDAKKIIRRGERPGNLAAIEAEITSRHAQAVMQFLSANGLTREAVNVIGFHGQTVLHRPDIGLTVQLGDGGELARQTGQVPYVGWAGVWQMYLAAARGSDRSLQRDDSLGLLDTLGGPRREHGGDASPHLAD